MSNEWEDITNLASPITFGGNCNFGVHKGYEYKLMRRKILTEREQFIEDCCDRCVGASSSADYGRIYDEGARFL